MYVLDTNVISELRKASRGRADAHVLTWASKVDSDDLYTSAMTLMEIELGILLLERRDPAQGRVLRNWMTGSLLPAFTGRILPITATVALACAKLHVPSPRPMNDAWIAATALVHGMTVVTRNVLDFEPMGVSLLNPWDDQPI